MRDTKSLEEHTKKIEYKEKEMELFKKLKKEVQTNAFGTREYVIKKGINKGKRIAMRTNKNNNIVYQCIKSMAELESNIDGSKSIKKLILN